MTVQDFIHRHYSPAVGESPTGHAMAVLAGLMLIVIGARARRVGGISAGRNRHRHDSVRSSSEPASLRTSRAR